MPRHLIDERPEERGVPAEEDEEDGHQGLVVGGQQRELVPPLVELVGPVQGQHHLVVQLQLPHGTHTRRGTAAEAVTSAAKTAGGAAPRAVGTGVAREKVSEEGKGLIWPASRVARAHHFWAEGHATPREVNFLVGERPEKDRSEKFDKGGHRQALARVSDEGNEEKRVTTLSYFWAAEEVAAVAARKRTIENQPIWPLNAPPESRPPSNLAKAARLVPTQMRRAGRRSGWPA